jgi:putative DNA primase/helicase
MPEIKSSTFKIYKSLGDAGYAMLHGLGAKEGRSYVYKDAAGTEVMAMIRLDFKDEKKKCLYFHPHGGGWTKGDPDGRLPLYGLDRLARSTGGVIIVEGEGKASLLWGLGFCATASSHGGLSARKSDWSPLAGRSVAILPDHNDVGYRYADDGAPGNVCSRWG